MAKSDTLSPFLPNTPLDAEQRALFDQYTRLAYRQARWAHRKYMDQPRVLVETAALTGLMVAASRYQQPSAASFATFAVHTIDWTIRHVVLRDIGLKQRRRKPSVNRYASFEPSSHRAAGDMPDAYYDQFLEEQVLVDRRTPESELMAQDGKRQTEKILETLSTRLNAREMDMLKCRMNNETLESIGRKWGISRERVRQIVERTLKIATAIAQQAA